MSGLWQLSRLTGEPWVGVRSLGSLPPRHLPSARPVSCLTAAVLGRRSFSSLVATSWRMPASSPVCRFMCLRVLISAVVARTAWARFRVRTRCRLSPGLPRLGSSLSGSLRLGAFSRCLSTMAARFASISDCIRGTPVRLDAPTSADVCHILPMESVGFRPPSGYAPRLSSRPLRVCPCTCFGRLSKLP